MTHAEGSSQWTAPQGFWGPPAMMAMAYMEYMQRYGATREDLGRVLVELRKHAARIPWAYWYGKPITLEDYLNARMIADPICILDCDIPIDGAVAFVFTSAGAPKDHPHKPVYVAGCAQGNPVIPGPMWSLPSIEAAAPFVGRDLWASTGLTRADIDLPQLYDGFSPIVYFWLEALGYCKRGEAHLFIREQKDLTKFFSGGGSLGNGRMHGVPAHARVLPAALAARGRPTDSGGADGPRLPLVSPIRRRGGLFGGEAVARDGGLGSDDLFRRAFVGRTPRRRRPPRGRAARACLHSWRRGPIACALIPCTTRSSTAARRK